MPTDDDGEEYLAEEYMQHVLMNETHAYVERGRAFETVGSDEIIDTWIAIFERWYGRRTAAHARDMNDLGAEIRLRGLELPYERIETKTRILQAELLRRTPDDGCPELNRRIDDFLDSRRRPKN